MKIGMACDHAGTELKEEIKNYLQSEGHEVIDFGTDNQESCDLSDYVYPASVAVSEGQVERGIFVDGVGYGSAMIANKLPGVFAAVCQDPFVRAWHVRIQKPTFLALVVKLLVRPLLLKLLRPGSLLTIYRTSKNIQNGWKKSFKSTNNKCMHNYKK